MKEFYIKSLILIITFIFSLNIIYAQHNVKMHADINNDFSIKYQDLPEEIELKTTESKTIPNVVSIPEGSTIKLKVIKAQRELRWHKGGVILCKLTSYTPEGYNTPIDLSDKNLYLTVRKHEAINKKEAWILGTEIVVMQGASFFAPGVDIGYFFIKGAIQREKHPNWFKAGVRNAYDNSIFWFPQKGKTIELEEGNQVVIKDIKEKKVEKFVKTIDKRNSRFERQAEKRIAKKEAKSLKKELKYSKKLVDCSVVEDAIEKEVIEKNVHAELAKMKTVDEMQQ